MYVPRQYQINDKETLHALIREHAFGILVSQTEGRLWGTHIPMHLSADGERLEGHISKGNLQRKSFSASEEVMAIFSGPHAYISSSWYDHENVPTWNYLAAHVYGTVEVLEGEALLQSLKQLTDHYEQFSERPVKVENFSEPFLQAHLNGLVGFSIAISRIEGVAKLSQNRDSKNYDAIIAQLNQRPDANAKAIANAMLDHRHQEDEKN